MRSVAAALAAGLLAAGCSSWNPLVSLGIKSEPAHKPTPLQPVAGTSNPRLAWSAAAGKSAGFALQPQPFEGKVYAAAGDGTVSVLDADSGRLASRIETKKPISGGLAIGDGRLLAGTAKGEALAIDASGKVLWTAPVNGVITSPPALARGTVVVRTEDGRVFGFALEDGKRRWVYQRPAPALLLRTAAGVMVSGGDVVAGFPNGKLIALDVDDGKLTWEVTVSPPRGATELERIADVAGAPLIDGANVCAGAFQGKVACFEISSRNMLWSRDLSTSRALARDARFIYAVDDSDHLHALAKATGASTWKLDQLAWRRLTAPVAFEGRVVVGDFEGFLHVVDPDNGTIVGRLATDGSAVTALVPTANGLLAQTANGLVALVRF